MRETIPGQLFERSQFESVKRLPLAVCKWCQNTRRCCETQVVFQSDVFAQGIPLIAALKIRIYRQLA